MLKFRSLPFEDEIEKATDENNVTEDWAIIMHICDNATNYQDGAKYCFKAIMKKLHHNVPRVVLQALILLDACVKNCDRKFLLQVASCEFTNEVRKLLPKMHPSTAMKLKELIQKWSLEEFKNDPELCIIPSFYYKLVSEGVEFPVYEKNKKTAPKSSASANPDAVNSQEEENDIIKAIEISLKETGQGSGNYTNGLFSEHSGKSLPEPFKVRVLFDFEAAEDNELTIKTGEIVLVVDNSNTDWWKGTNHRGEGLFPSNFVTENLDHIPDETEVKTDIHEVDKSNFIGDQEVKLDEEKIELVLNWLNETDPTGDSADPEEMLLLERECYKMAPLIEEELQIIDQRMAMLHLVNGKIMRAFETFHSLLDLSNPTLKHVGRNDSTALTSQCQVNFPTPAIWHPSMPIMAVPEGFQVFPTADKKQNVSTCIPSDLKSTDSQAKHSQIMSSNSNQASQSQSIASQVPQMSIGRYYMPSQAMPYPVTYSSSEATQHSFVEGASSFMTLPYSMPMVNPYFQFPHYYINSAVPSQSRTVTLSSSSNKNEHHVTQTSEPKIPLEVDSAKSLDTSNTSKMSNYSEDLQHLVYNSSSSTSTANPVASLDEQKDKSELEVCKTEAP